jgi:hypothetical protein
MAPRDHKNDYWLPFPSKGNHIKNKYISTVNITYILYSEENVNIKGEL